MSTSIEFRHVAFRLDGQRGCNLIRNKLTEFEASAQGAGDAADRFLVFVEQGCNNTITTVIKNGRPYQRVARHWAMAMLGTHHDIIGKACEWSYYINDGLTRLHSRNVTAEGYIRHYRKVLGGARPAAESLRLLAGNRLQWTSTRALVGDQPWLALLEQSGRLTSQPPQWGGRDNVEARTFTLRFAHDDDMIHADVIALSSLAKQGRTLWFTPCCNLENSLDVAADREKALAA